MDAATNVQGLYEDYAAVLDPAANAQSSWFQEDDWASEFETPDSQDDPRLKAATEEYEKNVLDTSPEQNVEQALLHYEKTYAAMDPYRWKDQAHFMGKKNADASMTRIMYCREFIRSLNRAGCRLSLNEYSIRGQVGMNFLAATEHGGQTKYIGAMQCPYCPEYSVMRFDEYNVPVNQKYIGWRTALLKCIFAGAVTEEQALEAFGLAYGPRATFYREQLYKWRNRVQR